MKKIFKVVAFFTILATIPMIGSAQCKGFTKKQCLPALEPYIYNGQLNSAILIEGDVAELLLTFYGGQDYRIYVCYQENIGKVEFRLLDTERNVIFHNKEQDFVKFWDFAANSTQQLIIQVKVPEGENRSKIIQSGCVSILVGFKNK